MELQLSSEVGIRPAYHELGHAPDEWRELRHEVGNALTSASGYAQLLLRRSPAWAAEHDLRSLEMIRESIERAIGLLSRAGGPPQRSVWDLLALVQRAITQLPPERLADVTLEVSPDVQLRGCWSGESVVQVIANLLSNAAKYSMPGTPVEIVLGRVADHAYVVVRDHGIGIDPDDLAHIFDGYRTIPARQMADGSGIGLRLSRRLAEAEGGHLRGSSVPGRGSVFCLKLPMSLTAPGSVGLEP